MLVYESKNLKVYEVDSDQVCLKLVNGNLFVFVEVEFRSMGMNFTFDKQTPEKFFNTLTDSKIQEVIDAVKNSDPDDDEIEIEVSEFLN